MNVEIERLTLLINRYKEKLTRRETTNRDLLVELQTYKTWKARYQEISQKCEQLKQELEKQHFSYEAKIIEIRKEITVLQTTIASLKSQLSNVQNERDSAKSEANRLQSVVTRLEEEIKGLRARIAELEARGPEVRIETKVVEVPVGGNLVVETKSERAEEEKVEAQYEEEFEVVGRVAVDESYKKFDLVSDNNLQNK